MKKTEEKLKVLHKLFLKYSESSDVYLHSEFLHKDVISPEVIFNIVKEIIPVKSAVDVGCGLGAWLSVLKDQGVDDILGIEGDHIQLEKLMISEENLIISDLNNAFPKIDKKFDLAICLEVAEHLSPEVADELVEFLCDLSDVVLFSAAVPYQGGINHINEQWVEYWKSKFNNLGYEYYDLIRSKIWNNKDVKWWYKQNCFLVMKKEKFEHLKSGDILNLIHPELFLQYRILQ